jgi:four helix bundle protein
MSSQLSVASCQTIFNRGYEDLLVWQKAVALAESVYLATRAFPKEELYGMASQLRRSAVSIPSNIAEGCARQSSKEFLHFLSIASGSTAELKTQLLIANRVQLVSSESYHELQGLSEEIARMLAGLRARIRKDITT